MELGSIVDLSEIFPEAKLTMRDRLPINFIYTNAIITIQKAILNIQYSSEELREAVQGFVAMIPDALKDEKFDEEIEAAKRKVYVDNRPVFCDIPASDEYLIRKGINPMTETETFDYFQVLHACFNLLMRKQMLLKNQPKEIFTGHRARNTEESRAEEIEEDEDDPGVPPSEMIGAGEEPQYEPETSEF